MLIHLLSVSLALIFFIIGGVHIYWFFGGKWGLDSAIPSTDSGDVSMRPSKFATLMVAFGLISFGLFYLVMGGLLKIESTDATLKFVGVSIPIIFLVRAIGDFNYVGFFKKTKNTHFAKMDRKYFSPLCLLIAISGLYIYFFR
jgi:hypothetical protein